MKKPKSYLQFFSNPYPEGSRRVTQRFAVVNFAGQQLGYIAFRATWRRYVFETFPDTAFDASCLNEIAGFLEEADTHHRGRT